MQNNEVICLVLKHSLVHMLADWYQDEVMAEGSVVHACTSTDPFSGMGLVIMEGRLGM